MTRRAFSMTFTGAFLARAAAKRASRVLVFEATAGPRLPHTLALRATPAESLAIEKKRGHVWEERSYRVAHPKPVADRLTEIFSSAGIRPLFGKMEDASLTYFIPFENLAARDRAWTALNTDPRWISARAEFESYRFGLYRLV